METKSLSKISASEALLLFQSRELSPVELMKSVIEQANITEPTINAFSDQYFGEALKKAAGAEQRYRNKNPGRSIGRDSARRER